jgi:secreted PhoX family phosphatase
VFFRWGDPVGIAGAMPPFRMDASNSAADQAVQAGMHHDGMHYFPIGGSRHGLLAMNHEYADYGLLFADGVKTWSAEKVAKAQAAVGVSVIEVMFEKEWKVVRPSRYARRITARTPCRISGPAAGHALMRTEADPAGTRAIGTQSGCGHGWTPWGTYLTCEENWQFAFVNAGTPSREQQRYGVAPRRFSAGWEKHDARFDAVAQPNEPHRFGWVVEVDPHDPQSTPVKRTALGRFMHEGAACAVGADRRLTFYMGDDDAFEHVYKFVTAKPFDPANRAANRDLLDEGTLYAARFNADGTGDWLALQGSESLIYARLAADALGATRMDRPEWIVPHPVTREVYCSLSNNAARGASSFEDADAANPRAPNPFGHILRWQEEGDTRFRWEVFVLAGPQGRGTVKGDAFGSPDALWIDAMGTLWVQTDGPSTGEYAGLGNNQLLAVDPGVGVFRRFLTGPRGCEITGFHTTPDNRTAFVNIQHPGEARGYNNPDNPRAVSNWPDFAPNGRPRSATVAIRRKDGGIIGT